MSSEEIMNVEQYRIGILRMVALWYQVQTELDDQEHTISKGFYATISENPNNSSQQSARMRFQQAVSKANKILYHKQCVLGAENSPFTPVTEDELHGYLAEALQCPVFRPFELRGQDAHFWEK